MRTTDPSDTRPRPLRQEPEDESILDHLDLLLQGDYFPDNTTDDSSSEDGSEADTDTLVCGEQSLSQDDSGGEEDTHIDNPFPTFDELLAECQPPPGYDGDTLGLLGWTCEYCGGDLTGWELQIHGSVSAVDCTGMCNLCYVGGLEDLLGDEAI
ncbi:E7 [Gull papillomavirus 1]|uniref:E7 n=1 Tax=Gull papillomavirus 1 TaxID=2562547 RepID=A0AAE6D2Y0_9PAPI|nr:E7 [Gull papillomavirus 1]